MRDQSLSVLDISLVSPGNNPMDGAIGTFAAVQDVSGASLGISTMSSELNLPIVDKRVLVSGTW